MVLDYHERKQVSKNRPKKRPFKFIFFFIAGIILAVYCLGFATGWFIYKARKTGPPAAPANISPAAGQKTGEAAPPADDRRSPQAANGKNSDPPLTFYQTLPKGEVAALGSGLNPAPVPASSSHGKSGKESDKALTSGRYDKQRQNSSSEPNNGGSSTDSATAKKEHGAGKHDDESTPDKSDASPKTYTVQAASCSTKKEAEAVKGALDRKGLLSYIVESRIQGKGTWYRVRLGNHLDTETAHKIAAKVGKNAIVIPE